MTHWYHGGFAVALGEDGDTELYAERLRDGRIALGTRRWSGREWEPSELHILEPPAYLALAGWLADAVEEAWTAPMRGRQPESLRTAAELFADTADGADRLAAEMLREIAPSLLRRAMLLLANAIGPETRGQLVERLNRTTDASEDAQLRRRLSEAQEALGYAVAAAALFDAVDRRLAGPAEE